MKSTPTEYTEQSQSEDQQLVHISADSTTEQFSIAAMLPGELTLRLFRHLNGQQLCVAALVCRSWHDPASDSALWKYNVLPEFRDDPAKLMYLRNPNARVTQVYLFQLIWRLCESERAHYRQIHDDGGTMGAREYRLLTGLDIERDDEINEIQTLGEVENLLRFSWCVNPNTPQTEDAEFPFTPVHAAVRAESLAAVKLCVHYGAEDLSVIVREAVINPEIFAYALEIYPQSYQDDATYQELLRFFAQISEENANVPRYFEPITQTRQMLVDHHDDYLRQASVESDNTGLRR